MSAFCLSMFFFISSLTYSYFYLYSRMCSCKSVLSFLTFSISVFWSLSIFFAYSSLWCSYLRRYISALSLLGSYSSIILTFLSAIFLTLAKQLWEKRFPCKPISIKVVFLFSFSSGLLVAPTCVVTSDLLPEHLVNDSQFSSSPIPSIRIDPDSFLSSS